MINSTRKRLQEINEQGYSLSAGQIMVEGFKYYRSTFFASSTALMLLIFSLSFGVSAFLTRYFDGDTDQIIKLLEGFDPFKLSLEHTAIYLSSLTFFSALSSVLLMGFLKIVAVASTQKRPSIFLVFKYFISTKGLMIFFAQFIVAILFSTITFFLQAEGLNLVALTINWLINILVIFVNPLIAFGNLGPLEAIKQSVMVVNKQPIAILFILLLNYLLVSIGFFLFVVGIFFTLPYLFCVLFTLYKEIIGYYPEEESK